MVRWRGSRDVTWLVVDPGFLGKYKGGRRIRWRTGRGVGSALRTFPGLHGVGSGLASFIAAASRGISSALCIV